jgi:hypothetical protein
MVCLSEGIDSIQVVRFVSLERCLIESQDHVVTDEIHYPEAICFLKGQPREKFYLCSRYRSDNEPGFHNGLRKEDAPTAKLPDS